MRTKADITQTIVFSLIRGLSWSIMVFLAAIIGFLAYKGFPAISWEFLTEMPRNAMTEGGIFPAIAGTVALMVGSTLVSVPLGIATAVYLTEYARSPRVVRFIRLAVSNLAGVPSVVYGLFGLAFFVIFLDFGSSILAGSITLGILNLPVIIRATEEALMAVPGTYREASLSLGATKLQTITKIVLPGALPGILTGMMLSLGRAAGETAPIMFTAATFYTPELPGSALEEVMALPYHIYVMATAGTHIAETRHIQYGTAVVLIALVLLFNLTGMIMRARYRRRLHQGG